MSETATTIPVGSLGLEGTVGRAAFRSCGLSLGSRPPARSQFILDLCSAQALSMV